MKFSLPILLAVVATFLFAACAGVEYEGESLSELPSYEPVKFYLATELEKMPDVRVLGTAEYTARPTLTSRDIREELAKTARQHGANGIRIISMEKIPDGEARRDQINNTGAPQWNVSDNSDTSLASMKKTSLGTRSMAPSRWSLRWCPLPVSTVFSEARSSASCRSWSMQVQS